MQIERCKWYNNADSPVLVMIDDLANAWVDTNHSGTVDWGEDWGYFKNEDWSSFRFLNEQILRFFPDVKVTFFVPVGVRVGMIANPQIKMVSDQINANEESKAFFRFVHNHPNYELAYHGTTHGIVGRQAADFQQEWATFGSLEEALARIGEGFEIFEDAVGSKPQGGKYCGYTSNEYSDDSINEAGFTWWCRYWNRGQVEGTGDPTFGNDVNPLTNYDVKYFGSRAVIDIPSTVNGALLNGISGTDRSLKGTAKRILKKVYIRRKLQEIDDLLENHLVISIQEHIAPSRDDGKRQSPNIFDDRESLIHIFNYLKGKHVWYCTGTELADYVHVRDQVAVGHLPGNRFTLKHDLKHREQMLTLKFSNWRSFAIELPNGQTAQATNGIVNVPVLSGEYSVVMKDQSKSGREKSYEGTVPNQIQYLHQKRGRYGTNSKDQRVY